MTYTEAIKAAWQGKRIRLPYWAPDYYVISERPPGLLLAHFPGGVINCWVPWQHHLESDEWEIVSP